MYRVYIPRLQPQQLLHTLFLIIIAVSIQSVMPVRGAKSLQLPFQFLPPMI